MKWFALLKKDLLIFTRDRGELLVLLLMPLAFIILISFALGAGDGYGVQRDNRMLLLPIADYDHAPRAQVLRTAIGESFQLEQNYGMDVIQNLGLSGDADCKPTPSEKPPLAENPACIEKAGRILLQRSQRTALLIIPKDFTRLVESGKPATVTLLYDPAGDAVQMQQIEGVVRGATTRLAVQNQVAESLIQLNSLAALAPESVRQTLQQQTNPTAVPDSSDSAAQGQSQPAQTVALAPALQIQKTAPSNAARQVSPDTYQQTIPGYTVMFVFFIIGMVRSAIRQERFNGTFRRLLSLPVNRSDLLTGKLLAAGLIGFGQVLLLFGAGALLFHLKLGNDPLTFLLLTAALLFAATSIGLAAATTRLKSGAMTAPLILSALLGGCVFPLDLMPPSLRTLSYLVPHRWALTGYQNLIVRGLGLQEVLPQIAVLLGFGLVFFVIAIRRFDFARQESD